MRLAGELMVATQVGLAVVALSAAALVTRSFINLQRTDLAFNAEQLFAAELAIPADRLAERARYLDLHERLQDRLTSMPGVRSVTPVLSVPFIGIGGGIDGRVALPGQGAEERRKNPIVNMEIITPSYFATIGTPVSSWSAASSVWKSSGKPRPLRSPMISTKMPSTRCGPSRLMVAMIAPIAASVPTSAG